MAVGYIYTDQVLHIYSDNLVDTLCGERNTNAMIRSGIIVSRDKGKFLTYNEQPVISVDNNVLAPQDYSHVYPQEFLSDGERFIRARDEKMRMVIVHLCPDCVAMHALRSFE